MKKVVVFGGAGLVGSRFLELAKFDMLSPTIEQLNLLDFKTVDNFLEENSPEVIINFAAITDVESAEKEKGNPEGLAYKVNALVPKHLSEASVRLGAHFIQISTEYVFSGEKDTPYTEEDKPRPINWYGETKYQGEKFTAAAGSSHTIMRISMPYTARYEPKMDLARRFLERLRNNQGINAIFDSDITPTLVDDIAYALIEIADKKPNGIYHAVSTTSTTPYKFACLIADAFGLDKNQVKQVTLAQYNIDKKAKLLKHSWLSPTKFIHEYGEGILHSVGEGIELFKNLS